MKKLGNPNIKIPTTMKMRQEGTLAPLDPESKTETRAEQLKQKYFDRLEKNRLYNENILNDISDTLRKSQVLDGNIIVKLLKFEGQKTNEGLLLEPKFKPYELSNGAKAADLDKFEYSSRAIVIKKPSKEYVKELASPMREFLYNSLEEEKTIVWLNAKHLMNEPAFNVDRTYPTNSDEFNGYLSIPVTAIQVLEA